jgi:hypothetical protein
MSDNNDGSDQNKDADKSTDRDKDSDKDVEKSSQKGPRGIKRSTSAGTKTPLTHETRASTRPSGLKRSTSPFPRRRSSPQSKELPRALSEIVSTF